MLSRVSSKLLIVSLIPFESPAKIHIYFDIPKYFYTFFENIF